MQEIPDEILTISVGPSGLQGDTTTWEYDMTTGVGSFARPTQTVTQTLIQTSTSIWKVQYNGQNRAIKFESGDGRTIITCGYDYMGRRFEKKVITNGTTTLHERYIYRGYLQIAAYDLREEHAEHPDLRFIIWDRTQEVATRPLAIRENGVWYTYGWNLTKNICELYGQEGFIRTIYTYSPYGQVTAEGDVTQPIQWSSEMYDAELGLAYYNFRYYNPLDGRWTRRDPEDIEGGNNLYNYAKNKIVQYTDKLGKRSVGITFIIEEMLGFLEDIMEDQIGNCPRDYPKNKKECESCINGKAMLAAALSTTLYAGLMASCTTLSFILMPICIVVATSHFAYAMNELGKAREAALNSCCK